MKQFKSLTPLFICFLAVSCATTGGVSKDPVVLAEHAIVDGKASFDTFLHLEAINRDALLKVDPNIHKYAEYLRKNAPLWLQRADALKNAYRANSSDANLINLTAATAVISQAITMSNTYAGRITANH